MIDHTGINVSELERSRAFYVAALAPLGYRIFSELPCAVGFGTDDDHLTSKDPGGDFWISRGSPQEPRTHIAFGAGSRDQVDEFHQQAVLAGGTDNGPAGLRPHYHQHYYASYVLDPDGYNIEAVYHLPE